MVVGILSKSLDDVEPCCSGAAVGGTLVIRSEGLWSPIERPLQQNIYVTVKRFVVSKMKFCIT